MRMNRYIIMAIVMVICGIALIGYSVVSGEGSAGIVVFIPVFYGSGIFAFLGVLCIMAAIILGFIGFAAQVGEMEDSPRQDEPGLARQTQPRPGQPRTGKAIKGGGVVLIGPIPIIFGSDAKTTMVLVVLAIILIIAVALLFYV
jgi:uncharacterized protein (TIGR00304 family)